MIAVDRMSVRQLRADRARLRRVVMAAAVAIVAIALLRTAVFPPHEVRVERVADSRVDVSSDALAQRFAAAWLEFDSSHPDAREQALAAFGSDAAWDASSSRRSVHRRVTSSRVSQVAVRPDGSRIVVVEAQVSDAHTTYLAVRVQRDHAGALQIVGAPAIVAAPDSAPAVDAPKDADQDVGDPVIREVVGRGLRNLLAGRDDDLRADLDPDAHVAVPASPSRLTALQRLTWTDPGASVLARVDVVDVDGVALTLDYELDLTRAAQGRWLIAAVHVQP